MFCSDFPLSTFPHFLQLLLGCFVLACCRGVCLLWFSHHVEMFKNWHKSAEVFINSYFLVYSLNGLYGPCARALKVLHQLKWQQLPLFPLFLKWPPTACLYREGSGNMSPEWAIWWGRMQKCPFRPLRKTPRHRTTMRNHSTQRPKPRVCFRIGVHTCEISTEGTTSPLAEWVPACENHTGG